MEKIDFRHRIAARKFVGHKIVAQISHCISGPEEAAVIAVFSRNVGDERMREKLSTREVKTAHELYALADKCARMEEGRLVPKVDAKGAPGPAAEEARRKKKKRPAKAVFAADPGTPAVPGKKVKAGSDPANSGAGAWCPLHDTNDHDGRDCHSLRGMIDRQKQRQAERVATGTYGNCYNCGEPGHLARSCPSVGDRGSRGNGRGGGQAGARRGRGPGRGQGRGNYDRPARGRDAPQRAEEEGGNADEGFQVGYQEPRDAACIHGGAYALASHGEFKRLSRAVFAAQPSVEEQRPLRWSHVPITFDATDHPDRLAGVGLLPLVVSPIIHNVVVSKMLVDGGAGLNLLSVKLMEKLQLTEELLQPTGSFQGVNPGTTQPLGKIVLPVTFGSREFYRTENVTFDVADIPLPYNGIIGRPALAKFMAVTHHAYNSLKMPTTWGVLTVKADAKDAVFCNELIFKGAAATTRADCIDDEPGGSSAASPVKKLRAAAERASGEDVPGDGSRGHQAPSKARLQEEPQMTKRVSLPGHTDRSFVISANLPPA